jgi:hypothetical protein
MPGFARASTLVGVTGILSIVGLWSPSAPACCAVGPAGRAVINADQSVIIIWDAATKTQHFIRKATFASEADNFGFLVPTPSQPALAESGNEAFPLLARITAPPPPPAQGRGRAGGSDAPTGSVVVLEEKLVAGFNAAVLDASSAGALVKWLEQNGYAFSPAVEAWAKPYIEQGWKITALKVAKADDATDQKNVSASALRLSFKTDRPLFPYREPSDPQAVDSLGASKRLLRIYFIADARYRGELTEQSPWTGKAVWSNRIDPEARTQLLEHLGLEGPANTGPDQWWLTEFEDQWPYRAAPADLYFSRDPNQDVLQRW